MNDKFSIKGYAAQISEERGDEADALMILRLNGNESQMNIIGLDPLMIGHDALKMADAMQTALNENFRVAISIVAQLKKGGYFKSTLKEGNASVIQPQCSASVEPDEAQDKANPSEDNREKAALKHFFDKMIDDFFEGGGFDEDDD